MGQHLCVVEDEFYTRLLPLVYFRPAYDLKCGIFSLKEKIINAYPRARIGLTCRPYLVETVQARNHGVRINEEYAESCLFINGRVLADGDLIKKIPLEASKDTVYIADRTVAAVWLSGKYKDALKKITAGRFSISDFDGISQKEVDVDLIHYPWDLINNNAKQIRRDIAWIKKQKRGKKIRGKLSPGVYLLNSKEVSVGEGSVIMPGVVINAEDGPVMIGKNVTIMPQSTIVGPAFIGDGSTIRIGAKIYEDTSIGPVCKIGGEVEASIVQGYSNKQHDGFLGHSYISPWVNLGAGTTVSDLKNNYGFVKVPVNGELVDSRSQFVGSIIGDHSKTAINTALTTGTVIGVSTNVFGSGNHPKYIPSFAWGGGTAFAAYGIERAADVARQVMARRKERFTASDERLFRKIFDVTAPERQKYKMTDR
jgi:UDP-N-acetylglucosamine diphosphorylase/glucosamine-1-phosphate N-acetyltransferase